MMELLAPAGSRDAMVAAVQNGADAIYIGGGAFNARRSAANFDQNQMQEALDYCHERGVKVYVTLNTLILDREMGDALEYAAFLHRAGADAAIIQDVGLAGLIRRELPGLPLHASTQMGIHTPEGARLAKRMGIERAVMAREVPLGDIRAIHESCNIELEAFAHGALCMSFSGGCLFSSMAGERSGNRGTCAQPCRKRIKLGGMPGEKDFGLSLGDLCMVENLEDMENAGVCCIKIEGRMKRPEYVAVVTRAYRMALDGADKEQISAQRRRMMDMFDRGGGSTGYFYGCGTSTGHVAQSRKPRELMEEAAASYARENRKLAADMSCRLEIDSPARLEMRVGGTNARVSGETVQRANKSQNPERYMEQLKKLGDTPFMPDQVKLDMDEWAFLPMSGINALRRDCCAALREALKFRREDIRPRISTSRPLEAERTVITAIVSNAAQAAAAFEAGADEVALEPCEYSLEAFEKLGKFRGNGQKLLMSLPAVTMGSGINLKIREIARSGLVDGAIAGNIGQLELIRDLPLKIAGSQTNVTNGYTVEYYKQLGFERVTLSLELTKPQLRDMAGQGTALSIYGRAQLMQLRHCPVKEAKGCRNCRGYAGEMQDESGRSFPLYNMIQDGCLVRLLNCVPTDITDLFGELPCVSAVQLAFYGEEPETAAERILAAKGAIAGIHQTPVSGATRGHWSRAVE